MKFHIHCWEPCQAKPRSNSCLTTAQKRGWRINSLQQYFMGLDGARQALADGKTKTEPCASHMTWNAPHLYSDSQLCNRNTFPTSFIPQPVEKQPHLKIYRLTTRFYQKSYENATQITFNMDVAFWSVYWFTTSATLHDVYHIYNVITLRYWKLCKKPCEGKTSHKKWASSVTKSCYSQMHVMGFESSNERFFNNSVRPASFVLIPHWSLSKERGRLIINLL